MDEDLEMHAQILSIEDIGKLIMFKTVSINVTEMTHHWSLLVGNLFIFFNSFLCLISNTVVIGNFTIDSPMAIFYSKIV